MLYRRVENGAAVPGSHEERMAEGMDRTAQRLLHIDNGIRGLRSSYDALVDRIARLEEPRETGRERRGGGGNNQGQSQRGRGPPPLRRGCYQGGPRYGNLGRYARATEEDGDRADMLRREGLESGRARRH